MRWRLSLALIVSASASLADPLTFLRSTALKGFGGLSAIEVEPGGSPALVLSDRGTGHRFAITRAGGRLQISDRVSFDLPGEFLDNEGLATSAAGTFYSYEAPAWVSTDAGAALPNHPDFSRYNTNGSLEALAVTADGVLYTLPEKSLRADKGFPIYRFADGAWSVATLLPRAGPFLPTGADFGPDGMLYILERSFSPLGFRSRVRRIDPEAAQPVAETLLTSTLGEHDNLEGLSVWQSRTGATCLTMVSDDNFLSIQTTELVEYALTETLAVGRTCD